MGADGNKVYLKLGGRSVIEYSLATALACPSVTHVVVVARPEDLAHLDGIVGRETDQVLRVVDGGQSRHQSEYRGVVALRAEVEQSTVDVVAVHDAARPFMTVELLQRTIDAAAAKGAALPACPVHDTLYMMDDGRFVDSDDYAWVQTPQTFNAGTLLTAHDAAAADGFEGVDTAEVVQRYTDQPIHLVDGDPSNLKLTYRQDLGVATTTATTWGWAP